MNATVAAALERERFEQLVDDVAACLPPGSAFAVLELMGAASRSLVSPPVPPIGFVDAAIARLAAILDVDLGEPPEPFVYDWAADGLLEAAG